jgi:hypothetical protein
VSLKTTPFKFSKILTAFLERRQQTNTRCSTPAIVTSVTRNQTLKTAAPTQGVAQLAVAALKRLQSDFVIWCARHDCFWF